MCVVVSAGHDIPGSAEERAEGLKERRCGMNGASMIRTLQKGDQQMRLRRYAMSGERNNAV